MCRFEVKKTTYITIFLFIFLLITNSFTLSSNPGKDYKVLLESGERLLTEGEYEKAEEEFLRAVPLIKDTKTLAILHHLLSLVYFKMGDKERCEESLREMFELEPGKKINAEEYGNDYVIAYNKVKAEYWYSLKTISEEEEEIEQKIIEKLAHKPKKKKSKLLRILTLAVIVVISGILAAVLLGLIEKKKSPEYIPFGRVRVYNESTFTVWFSIWDIQDILYSTESKLYSLPKGTYIITFFDDYHSQTQLVMIYAEGLTNVHFTGWDESTVIR